MPLYGVTLLDQYAMWVTAAQLAEGASQFRPSDKNYFVVKVNEDSLGVPGLCALLEYCTEHPLGLPFEERFSRSRLIARCRERMKGTRKGDTDYCLIRFWWPCTRSGWKKRAAFAWKMAEQVAREMDGPA